MASDHKSALALATAAWVQLHGVTQAFQAAVLRGDREEAERLRVEAHDVLDSNLDQNFEAATAVRAMIRD